MNATKPYKIIRLGDIHGPRPYEFIGFRATIISQTPVAQPRPDNGHEPALELVSGANFGCILHQAFFEPDPLERVSGPSSAGKRPKTT